MTFPALVADFDERVREVDLFFTVLLATENDELAIVAGTGPQNIPIGAPPLDLGRMLKGAAYLVLYNLVEAFLRRGFQEVFDAIKVDGVTGIELSILMREQWIEQRNRRVKAFDGSPRTYMDIAQKIVAEIVDKKVTELRRDRLPFSGNLDADVIRNVCRRHGVDSSVSPAARGGDALKTVKSKRNSLSHGDESFSECGRLVAAAELWQIKAEVVQFMRDILNNLAQFVTAKGYKLVP